MRAAERVINPAQRFNLILRGPDVVVQDRTFRASAATKGVRHRPKPAAIGALLCRRLELCKDIPIAIGGDACVQLSIATTSLTNRAKVRICEAELPGHGKDSDLQVTLHGVQNRVFPLNPVKAA